MSPSELAPRDAGAAAPGERRIAAIVLPELLCEAARRLSPSAHQESRPLAVLLALELTPEPPNPARTRLRAVNFRAHQLGLRPGQTITEARAEVSSLRVETVTKKAVERLVLGVAEVARAFGSAVSYDLQTDLPDTVWVEVSGSAHLFGGEAELATELRERVRQLGHTARVVIASGPRLARALGQAGALPAGGVLVVTKADTPAALRHLPLGVLPELAVNVAWFSKLGILTWGQLAELPRETSAPRLGPDAAVLLELLQGKDDAPLTPFLLPAVLEESQFWEEATDNLEPLLFAMRGLLSRISARLEARGEACCRLQVTLFLENSAPHHSFEFELPSPIWRESELVRLVKSRLERTPLRAAVLGLALGASGLAPRLERQLGLSAGLSQETREKLQEEQELPLLLAELAADVGPTHVGVLELLDHHRPEARSALLSLSAKKSSKLGPGPRGVAPHLGKETDRATRLFSPALPVTAQLQVGGQFALGRRLYTIERLSFAERLEDIEWWSAQSTRRDYLWAWLQSESGGTEALMYVDRRTGQRFLQALAD